MSGINPRDYPICERCGHSPSSHTTTSCSSGHDRSVYKTTPPCDCPGWKLDVKWGHNPDRERAS